MLQRESYSKILTMDMRAVLVDWLVDVTVEYWLYGAMTECMVIGAEKTILSVGGTEPLFFFTSLAERKRVKA